MQRKSIRTGAVMFAALLCAASAAGEAGSIELRARAEKRLFVQKPDGTAEEAFVPATKVVPGDVVAYTIEARNVSPQGAERVVITDPIPAAMNYLDGTANAAGAELHVLGRWRLPLRRAREVDRRERGRHAPSCGRQRLHARALGVRDSPRTGRAAVGALPRAARIAAKSSRVP